MLIIYEWNRSDYTADALLKILPYLSSAVALALHIHECGR